jgi:HSP20 family protein
MSAAKSNENLDLKYVKHVISQVMGQDVWNGFYDVVANEKPRIDMYDDGENLYIVAEAPGIIGPNDIAISTSTNKLSIRGTMKDKYQRHKPGKMLKSECLYGSFNRTIVLPYPVDEKNIKAVYESGILEIVLKKTGSYNDTNIDIEFKK